MFIDIGATDGFLHKTGLRTSPNRSALTSKHLAERRAWLPYGEWCSKRESTTDVRRRAANASKYSVQSSSLFQNAHRVKSWFAFECNYLEDTFVFPKVFTVNSKSWSLMVAPTVHQALSDTGPWSRHVCTTVMKSSVINIAVVWNSASS